MNIMQKRGLSVDKPLFLYILYMFNMHNMYKGGVLLDIVIKNLNAQPIYEQIYEQIKSYIIAGDLSEGDMLPSIRTLAKDLRISVITTKRAYDELEKHGYIYTVASKGCYVAQKNTEIIKEDFMKKIEEHMREIQSLALTCHLTDRELLEMFRMVREEE